MDPSEIEAAFLAACEDELLAIKPGNVHDRAPGHRMTSEDFRVTARAAAPHIAASGLAVGARIEGAVAASLRAAGQNTNLGIVLLCAPLAGAASMPAGDSLRGNLRTLLAAATQEDAAAVFRAIVLANPGGLGGHATADVRASPGIGLLDAMSLAAHYDRIARAYVTGYEDVFELGLPATAAANAMFEDKTLAVSDLFLTFLSGCTDSHIQRKFGEHIAEAVRVQAAGVRAAFREADAGTEADVLLAFDRDLKRRGLNPGTSADLTVATLFAATLISGTAA